MSEEKDRPCVALRKLIEREDPWWRKLRDAQTREEAFFGGDRYEDDNGPENKDRRLTQIRGQEIQDTVRHVAAEATSKPRSLEARPQDEDYDEATAEVWTALIERELDDPWKGFNSRYYEAVFAARKLRLGIVWADWEPDCRDGEIIFSYGDPRGYMWDKEYDPHHPLCAWLLRSKRIDVEVARKRYKAPWLEPDKTGMESNGTLRPNVPLIKQGNGQHVLSGDGYDDNKVTIWECWYKNDPSTYKRKKPGTYEELPPEQWYMACTSGCGYRSESQGALQESLGEDGLPKLTGDLPAPDEVDELGMPVPPMECPRCAEMGQQGTLERISATEQEEEVRSFSNGKRLVVMAPYCPAPDDEPLYDGKWPIPRCRSFPGLFIFNDIDPGRPVGGSDVQYMWDQQVASDNLRTMALQRVFEHRNYWVIPAVGVTDVKGKRFEARDDQYNVLIVDQSKSQWGPLDIKMHNGTGLDVQGWSATMNVVQEALTQYRGVADFGLTQESSKNIAVGTVQTIERQGNIPIAEFNRRKSLELSKFCGVLSDMIRATYTPEKLSRIRLEGIDLLVQLWGEDMPSYDFVVEDSPEFTGLEKARTEAWTAIMQAYGQALQFGLDPMALIEIYAEVNHLPPSVVRKFEKMFAAQQQAMMMGGPGMPPGGDPGGSSPEGEPVPPEMDMLNQLNGSGMVPEPVGA